MTKRKFITALCLIVFIFANYTTAYAEPEVNDPTAPPQLKSEAAIMMDQKTGKILYDKNSGQKAYPASLTKIMTALLILENMDMKEMVTVGREIDNVESDASEAGLKVGDRLSGADLLWALMLPSGNDAAYTAAVHIARKKSGDAAMEDSDAVRYFAGMMNERARSLGAKNSNFVNPDGYPHEDHYSTAHDLVLISREAIKNDFFREIVSTYVHARGEGTDAKAAADDKKKQAVWYNLNQLINKKSKYYYEYARGIKTGHTKAAGYCLSSYAEKDDKTFITIVLKADIEENRWLDTTALFKYGFNNYKYHTFLQKGEIVGTAGVVRKYFGDKVDINILAQEEYTDIISEKEFAEIKTENVWDSTLMKEGADQSGPIQLMGPISKGQVVGVTRYTMNGKVLFETSLVASNDALKGDLADKVVKLMDNIIANKIIVIICLAAAVIIAVVLVIFLKRKRKA